MNEKKLKAEIKQIWLCCPGNVLFLSHGICDIALDSLVLLCDFTLKREFSFAGHSALVVPGFSPRSCCITLHILPGGHHPSLWFHGQVHDVGSKATFLCRPFFHHWTPGCVALDGPCASQIQLWQSQSWDAHFCPIHPVTWDMKATLCLHACLVCISLCEIGGEEETRGVDLCRLSLFTWLPCVHAILHSFGSFFLVPSLLLWLSGLFFCPSPAFHQFLHPWATFPSPSPTIPI